MEQSFLKRIISKPPTVFPWVALFHLLMLAFSIYVFSDSPFPSLDWIGTLWVLLMTICWIFICDMKRWAALTYIFLVIINIVLRFALESPTDLATYTHVFFPIDVLFCFFVLFYFKRFD